MAKTGDFKEMKLEVLLQKNGKSLLRSVDKTIMIFWKRSPDQGTIKISLGHAMAEDDKQVVGSSVDYVVVLQLWQVGELGGRKLWDISQPWCPLIYSVSF